MDFSAERYIGDVLSGRVVVGRWVRLAVERHVRDLETGQARGLWFDEVAAKLPIAFFSVLKHSKGEWAGRRIELAGWQQFMLWVLFGWKRLDGSRRFRTGYITVGRKNGKTTVLSGVGLYLVVADGEGGAEVYTVATKRDQARIAHGEAVRMVKQSRKLGRELTVFKDNIHSERTFSKYEPLASDYNSLDGLNPHGVIADEVHAWRVRELWDVLERAMGARRQPLMLGITTAGFDNLSLCWQLQEYGEKVLSGVVDDDSYFALIYTLDEGDDWEDEGVWLKSNPNLGVSKSWDYMRRAAERARQMPSALNAFLRMELNVWTQAESRWVDEAAWARCGLHVVDEARLVGRKCFGGLDLASNTDITAWVMVFPPLRLDGLYEVLCRFFIPEDNIQARVRRDRVPYDVWVREGLITATPGNVTDHAWVIDQIGRDAEVFDVVEVAFDRWGAAHVQTLLQERGLTMVQFGQGFASMAAPMREAERLILDERLAHGDNKVLNWMFGNLVARSDPAGNLKPDKDKSREKIDGAVGMFMGLDRALRHGGGRVSVYKKRGLRMI